METIKHGDILTRKDMKLNTYIDNSIFQRCEGYKVWIKLKNGKEDWFHNDHLLKGNVILSKVTNWRQKIETNG